MSAIPATELEGDLVRFLDRHRSVRARDLMPGLGLRWTDNGSRFDAHVKFLNTVIRARKELERQGFTIKTSGGGSMADFYWIEPHGAIS